MTLTALKNTPKRSATAIPSIYGRGAAVDILYAGGMACLNSAGYVVPAGSAGGPHSAVLGRIEATVDNSAGSAGDVNVDILPGQFRWDNSGTSIVTADIGKLCYAVDDESVHISNAGNRSIAGTIINVDSDGVWVQTLFHCAALGSTSGQGLGTGPVFYARGASTANIANLASFTVAGVDGLTYVQGERILLKDQSTPAQNGVYVVGAVGGGTAPLTRAPEMDDATELVPNLIVRVSEGTVAIDTAWTVTTNATIVVGTTALTFVDAAYIFGAVGAMVAEAIGSAASAGTSNEAARIDHRHAMPASAAPVPTGEVLVTGAAGTFADSAHVHSEYDKSVRYVMATNVANLAAFTVAQDGVTGVEGDLVLLANQTTAAECGVYVLGVVDGGTAPLTRAAHLPAGAIVTGGYTCHVNEGTLFACSSWFIATAGQITIGTTAHTWYPESVVQALAIPAGTGTLTITNVPILSATKTMFNFTNQSEITADLTVRYGLNGAATAGTVGTASVAMIAEIAAGTVNVDDDSTMLVQIVNR